MASLAEQIVAAVTTAIYNQIPAVGTRVYRARQDAVPPAELPAILIASGVEDPQPATLAGDVMRCEFDLTVSIHVAAGDVWETAADTLAELAHARFAAAVLPGTAVSWVGPLITDEAISGDDTPGVRTLTYTVTHYRQAAALNVAA
jgi:hypothetical protein